MTKIPLVPVLLSLLVGCNAAAPIVVKPSREFALKLGQAAQLDGTDLILAFEAVSDDSRCPRKVTCVWQGNAGVELRLTKTSTDESRLIKINTSGTAERRATLPSGFVELRNLEPGPPVEEPRNYLVTLWIGATS